MTPDLENPDGNGISHSHTDIHNFFPNFVLGLLADSSVQDGLPLTLCSLSAGVLLWVPLSPGRHRLGGSALAQCYSQLGDCSPDLDEPELLTACFNTTQTLIHGQLALTGTAAEKK